jgi:hypothetical protein
MVHGCLTSQNHQIFKVHRIEHKEFKISRELSDMKHSQDDSPPFKAIFYDTSDFSNHFDFKERLGSM